MRFLLTILLLVTLIGTTNSFATPATSLQALAKSIDTQCSETGIPGLAFVLVKDDQVILEHCYGQADPANDIPVTPNTIFPVGSTSKPFTSVLTAKLVSDGDLNWDDPITKHLPWFQLQIRSEDPDARVLIRDLLSHRTGIFSMDLIQEGVNWQMQPDFVPPFDRPGIMRAAMEYEPTADFRQKHQYSNVSMVAVAEAGAAIAKTSWDDLMQRRLFKPLGMNRSGTVSADLAKMNEVAVGHLRGEDGYDPAMALDMDCISPAGGVWSSLTDMTRFLRFLLQSGELDGKRLIAAEDLHETWTEQIDDASLGGQLPGAKYGLGWFLFDVDGLHVVEHGGNALGYSATMVMIPEKKIGFVMMSNALPNMMQVTLSKEVWQALDLVE